MKWDLVHPKSRSLVLYEAKTIYKVQTVLPDYKFSHITSTAVIFSHQFWLYFVLVTKKNDTLRTTRHKQERKKVKSGSKRGCGWEFRVYWPRSPPRLAELQWEWVAAISWNLALPETMSSRIDFSWETAASLVVLEITRPSGSFQENLRRDSWCLMSIWDAFTLSPPAP